MLLAIIDLFNYCSSSYDATKVKNVVAHFGIQVAHFSTLYGMLLFILQY